MKKLSAQRGFNLIELVFVILLVAILSVVASKFIAQAVLSYNAAYQVTDTTWQGRLAYSRFLRDVRQIRSPPDISTFTTNELTFVDMTGTTFDYVFTGSALTLNGNVLANGVTGGFSYFDVNIAAASVAANIVYVSISINTTQNNAALAFSATAELRDFNS
jgi:prepilin-type N-terminal cleavage/methylation domain-containing protein